MDMAIYILKLEKENLRLQNLLKEKEEELQEKVTEGYQAGFITGIKNGEQNIREQRRTKGISLPEGNLLNYYY